MNKASVAFNLFQSFGLPIIEPKFEILVTINAALFRFPNNINRTKTPLLPRI